MKEEIALKVADKVIRYGGFTPLELLLIFALIGVLVVFWKFVQGNYTKMVKAIENSNNVTENNTKAFKDFEIRIIDRMGKYVK